MPNYRDRSAEVDARVNSSPEHAAAVAKHLEAMRTEERIYKMTLAAIRKAGELTQTELAEKLGKNQGNIARTESSKDMLYSTLLEYLAATGATDIALTANIGGTRVEVDLASV